MSGERDATDPNGIQGVQGVQGIQGVQGVEGAEGAEGPAGGVRGERGPRGLPGKTVVTRLQFLAGMAFVLFCFLLLAWRSEVNAAAIRANTERLVEQRYQGCLGGVQIIERFNTQMHQLAEIERRNLKKDPLAGARIKAYEDGITTLPVPACRR